MVFSMRSCRPVFLFVLISGGKLNNAGVLIGCMDCQQAAMD